MENIYIFLLVVLFILAVSDLIVGISNDAVNFLNSAVGSNVAPFKVILLVAACGILIGTTFSSGMMEIARSGVFYPQNFYFNEIIIIFLAVMIADVIILDTFNSLGLPTSTTVSVIFELLGAAVAISLIKIFQSAETLADISSYINTGKALGITSGILLSVALAFVLGTIVQFFTRLLFTFNYKSNLRYFGSIWGSIAISSIIYFMIVRGARGASFMTPEILFWLETHTLKLLIISFLSLTIFFQFLITVFRINILKIVVMAGTFSLAMAFAGNDLVNFIGVPLAGYESIKVVIAEPSVDPANFSMELLLNPVKTPTGFLILAGIIMVITLFLSKKSRFVTRTEVDLSRQDYGEERFSSTVFSRIIVRQSIESSKFFRKFLPKKLLKFIQKRFDQSSHRKKSGEKSTQLSFDLLRASVNMFVASILIAFATSLKLPLSTTYVTFMVAMGTSLSDRAWGRENAVYRITGVFTVIAGWFFTSFSAFSLAFLIAVFIHWGGNPAILFSLVLAITLLLRTYFIQRKKIVPEPGIHQVKKEDTPEDVNITEKCNQTINGMVLSVSKYYFLIIHLLIRENRKELKKLVSEIGALNQQAKELKNDLFSTLKKLEDRSVDTGHFYVQIVDYMREIAHCLNYIADPVYEYIDNNHPPLIPEQAKDLNELNEAVSSFYSFVLNITRNQNFMDLGATLTQQQQILDRISVLKKKQIKFIKEEMVGTRNTLLYLNILSETKNLVLYTVNMLKSHRDFVKQSEIDTGRTGL
jgi:phosphate/sulfate permease